MPYYLFFVSVVLLMPTKLYSSEIGEDPNIIPSPSLTQKVMDEDENKENGIPFKESGKSTFHQPTDLDLYEELEQIVFDPDTQTIDLRGRGLKDSILQALALNLGVRNYLVPEAEPILTINLRRNPEITNEGVIEFLNNLDNGVILLPSEKQKNGIQYFLLNPEIHQVQNNIVYDLDGNKMGVYFCYPSTREILLQLSTFPEEEGLVEKAKVWAPRVMENLQICFSSQPLQCD